MRKYFSLFLLVYLSICTKNAYSNEQVCLAQDAQNITQSCCINTAEFTVIDSGSTACSCTVKWSEPKKLCQCRDTSLFVAGKCRTAQEVIALDAYQQQVTLMKVPVYVFFLAKESKTLQSNTLTVNFDEKELTVDISKIRFSYQLSLDNRLSITFYSPIFKQDNDFIRALFSSHIATFNGFQFSGCSFSPNNPNIDKLSSAKPNKLNYFIKVAAVNLKVQPEPKEKAYSIEDFQTVILTFKQSESNENSLCRH